MPSGTSSSSKSILIALYSLVWIWGISGSYTLVAQVQPDWFVKSAFVPWPYYYSKGKLIQGQIAKIHQHTTIPGKTLVDTAPKVDLNVRNSCCGDDLRNKT